MWRFAVIVVVASVVCCEVVYEEFDESSGGYTHKTTVVDRLPSGLEKTVKTTETHQKNKQNGKETIDKKTVETLKYANGSITQIEKHDGNEKVIENVNCTEDEHCHAGSFCNGLKYTCVQCHKDEATCIRDAQCCKGFKCHNNTCQNHQGSYGDQCQSNEDCLPGHCCASQMGFSVCKARPGLNEACGQSGFFGFSIFDIFGRRSNLPSSCPCTDGLECQMKRSRRLFSSQKKCSPPSPKTRHHHQHQPMKRESPFDLDDDNDDNSNEDFISERHHHQRHGKSLFDGMRSFLDDIFGGDE